MYWIIRYWGSTPHPIKEQSYQGKEEAAESYAERELTRLKGSRFEVIRDLEAEAAMAGAS